MQRPNVTTTQEFTLPVPLAAWLETLAWQWHLTVGEVLTELLVPVMQHHHREALYEKLGHDTAP